MSYFPNHPFPLAAHTCNQTNALAHIPYPPFIPITGENKSDPSWVADQQGWITALFSLGCIFGSLPSGALTDKLGPKRAIILLAAVFSVGAIIQLVPPDYPGSCVCMPWMIACMQRYVVGGNLLAPAEAWMDS